MSERSEHWVEVEARSVLIEPLFERAVNYATMMMEGIPENSIAYYERWMLNFYVSYLGQYSQFDPNATREKIQLEDQIMALMELSDLPEELAEADED